MKYEKYFKDMFESIPDYRKIVLIKLLIKNDSDLLRVCGFLKSDINGLSLKFTPILLEENEEYLEYVQNEEQSTIERIPNK